MHFVATIELLRPKCTYWGLCMNAKNHHQFMSLALKLAKKGRYTTAPNPMVGCVIVKNNQIIATGYHHKYGGHHAEVLALNQAGSAASGATMYINLEPCCHFGKTPPCAPTLITAGIVKVFIAHIDPNPIVSGSGIKALQAAGIEVNIGLLEEEAKQLNRYFIHYIVHKRPYVIAKWAMSLDGKTVTNPEDSRQISGDKSNKLTHQVRKQVDAIIVGANTVLADNPKLTARIGKQKKQPVRVVLFSYGVVPLDSSIFDLSARTLVVTTNLISKEQLDILLKRNIEVIITKPDLNNQIDLIALLDELWKIGIYSVLVEGGMQIHQSFIKANLINELIVYVAPVIIGDFVRKIALPNMSFGKIGDDCLLSGYLNV